MAPPGGSPAALTNLPGTGGAFGRASSVAGYALGVLPGQSARFTSEPLAAPLTLIGSSRIDLDVTGTHIQRHPVRVAVGSRPRYREHGERPEHCQSQLGSAAPARSRASQT